jgi:PAS domain S-box-containing protein
MSFTLKNEPKIQPPKSRYDLLFLASADGVFVIDKSNQVISVNPAGCAMLALTKDDIIGRTIEDLFNRNPQLMNLFQRKGEQKLEIRLPRRRVAQGIGEDIENNERMVILQDITEQRDLENRREHLTRTIAHDLRNPLSAITGFIDLVTKSGALTDIQTRFLLRARQTTNKIHEMIVTLVDLSWIDAGMPLRHVPIHLDETISQAIRELEPLAKKQNIGIVLSMQKPLPQVMGDPERLHLAIYNILHNAIIYTLDVEKNIVVHAWSDDTEIYCNIADRGVGILDTELKLIFDRMYRSRDERIAHLNGGGLGLTIARAIIQRHGGDIWASSNISIGTTISFVLPIVEKQGVQSAEN